MELTFDLKNDHAPLIVVLDVQSHELIDKISVPRTITIQRLRDRKPRTLRTKITPYGLNDRLRIRLIENLAYIVQ